MQIGYGLLVELEAAPGQGEALAAFLVQAREMAVREAGTVTWYAFKAGDASYGIFDTFATEDARKAHLGGEIPVALGAAAAQLLAAEPRIRPVDILGVK
jgi:quinol monooxygenase YgiN